MKTIILGLFILGLSMTSCYQKIVQPQESTSLRLITFRFGEEFDHDSINIWNGGLKIFHTNFICYLPGTVGSSFEQEARIDLDILVPNCSDSIVVFVGRQRESILIDSSKSKILVYAKANYDENYNLIIDSTLRHWPFHLLTE